ncbi:MAG: serine acetyltransferase [Bacteroidales bacterium]|nr:serine acetyltransferase [Bacteroidales bacterium]MBN2820707.1 serine acetyltransferase [Bacteroidales bacterium]
MIDSFSSYKYYLEEDRKALLGTDYYNRLKLLVKHLLQTDKILMFQRQLRKVEYLKNCKYNSVLGKIRYFFVYRKFIKLSLLLNFSIPPNVFGPGLSIAHYGTIVINPNTRIGKNCRIHVCVNIGASGGNTKAPMMGDNVYIAPGVKIFGDIKIGNNIAVSANSTVNKSFTESNILLAGSPAKKVKEIDIYKLIPHAKEV